MSTFLVWNGPLLSWLGKASWQAGVLVLLVLLAQRLFRKHLAPPWRHALWFLVVARLCLPVGPSSPVSLFKLMHRDAPMPSASLAVPTIEAQALDETPPSLLRMPAVPGVRAEDPLVTPAAALVPPSGVLPVDPSPVHQERPVRDPWRWLSPVWVLGIVFLALRWSWQNVRFSRRLAKSRILTDPSVLAVLADCRCQLGVRRRLDLMETPLVRAPALYGLLHPRLLLPTGLVTAFSRDELRYVLLHELAHLKRQDLAVNWLITLLQMLHWFNPLIWLGFRRMRADRELACDAMVLANSRDGDARPYGQTIVKVLETFMQLAPVPGLVGILEETHELKRRLRWIARFQRSNRWPVLAVLLLTGLGLIGLTEPPSATAAEGRRQLLPIDLTPYYDRDLSDFDKPGVWEVVPHGRQEFGVLPFEMSGLLQLYGKGSARNMGTFRDRVRIDLGGRQFAQLHVVHGTAFSAPIGTPVARLAFSYADGTRSELPILYGHQVRDWWRAEVEFPARVVDPNTKVIWRGTHRSVEASCKTLRLYRTTLPNPRPTKPVANLELTSTREEPTWIIVAMTTDSAAPGSVEDNTPDLEVDNPPLHGRLAFHVVSEVDGKPIEGATVEITHGDSWNNTPDKVYRTDEAGTCAIELAEPPPSVVRTRTSKPGFAALAVDWYGNRKGRVTAQGIPQEYTLRLPPAVPIGGVVQDEAGAPIEDVELCLRPDWGVPSPSGPLMSIWNYVFKTDAEGHWHCNFMAALNGDLLALLSHEEYALKPSAGGSRWCRLDRVQLAQNSAVIVMNRGGHVRGTVSDAQGRTIEGALVSLEGQGSTSADLSALTDSQGQYAFRRAQLGNVTVKVEAKGHPTTAQTLDVLPDTPPVDFQLGQPQGLRGRVVDATGAPLADVRVIPSEWRDMSYGIQWRGTTDAEGRFFWAEAPDEAVGFDFLKQGYGSIRRRELKPGKEEQSVVMQPALKVSGTVRDAATGNAIPSFTITRGSPRYQYDPAKGGKAESVFWGTKASGSVSAHQDGHYTIALDEHVFLDPSEPPSFYLKVQADGYQPTASRRFRLEEGAVEWNVELVAGANCSGVVRLADGHRCAGARLCLVSQAGLVRLDKDGLKTPQVGVEEFRADAEGRFSFPRQLDGTTLLIVAEEGYAQMPASEVGSNQDLIVAPWGRIEGTLRHGELPGSGVTLTLAFETEGVGTPSRVALAHSTVTDAEGGFRFERVPPGLTQIAQTIQMTERSSSRRYLRLVDVRPGGITRCDIGGAGRPVVGRFQLPDSIRDKVDWTKTFQSVRRDLHRIQAPMTLTTAQEHQAWHSRWLQTQEGRAYYRLQNESFSGMLGKDGTFRIEDMPPGNFTVFVRFRGGAADTTELATAALRFSVPDTGVAVSREPLDIGEIPVRAVHPITEGEAAPDFELPGLDEASIRLSAFRGRHVVLHVCGALDYPPARQELSTIREQMAAFAQDPRLAILGIVCNTAAADALALARQLNLGWPQAMAGFWPTSGPIEEYGAVDIVLIDPEGVVKATRIKAENLRDEVAKALGALPTPTHSP